eukprot:372678-Prymnesium_polylepis.1
MQETLPVNRSVENEAGSRLATRLASDLQARLATRLASADPKNGMAGLGYPGLVPRPASPRAEASREEASLASAPTPA